MRGVMLVVGEAFDIVDLRMWLDGRGVWCIAENRIGDADGNDCSTRSSFI
jgi:hypothetical protein